MITKIKNGIFITDKLVKNKSLYIKDGKILCLTDKECFFDTETDAKGLYISPGFIDIHVHGGGGYDFSDGSTEDVLKAAYFHAIHGTTTIYPTAPSLSPEATIKFINNVKSAMSLRKSGNPYIAGSHLEGPYFAVSQRGAQDIRFIRKPVPEEYETLVETSEGTLKRISYAPELEGSRHLCEYLNKHCIVSGFGHTDGVYEEIKPLIDLGCSLATHLYSGMNTVTRKNMHRKLGAVETAFLEESVTVEIIADGVHLPKELLRLIFKIKGPDKICLVTDSMRGAGQQSGMYILGPKNSGVMTKVIKDDIAYLPDMTAFAGSVATADRLLRVMYKEAGIPLTDCIKMLCETPARVMNLTDRGKLADGYWADLVFFDENINVKMVLVQGEPLI